MLLFAPPKIEDKAQLHDLLMLSGGSGNEFCFGNIFIWKDVYQTEIARLDDMLLIKYGANSSGFAYPAGKVDITKAVEAMLSAADGNAPLKIYGCTYENFAVLEGHMTGSFTFRPHRGKYDYIYSLDDLSELVGRKYHAKRNHISAFEKENPGWSFEPINKDNIADCRDMSLGWLEEKERSEGAVDEASAVKMALDNYFELGFIGGVVFAGGRAVAFTLGEELTETTFCTHIEKAYYEVRGAYPIVNREFARMLLSKGFSLVNREEDTGNEALRKAKLSYYPSALIAKGTATYVGGRSNA